jgi:hypothetical protein
MESVAIQHPLDRDEYTVSTPAIVRFVNIVKGWTEWKVRGGIIFGRARAGKSNAIDYFRANVREIYGHFIATFVVGCERQRTPRERDFLTRFLTQIGHDVPSAGSNSDKVARIVEFLHGEALRCNDNRVILFLDDAQWLHDTHLDILMVIYNDLERRGTRLFVVLVGQKELLARREALRIAQKFQLVGRFMVGEHEFRGIQNADEIKYILTRYDEFSEYPEGSNVSFTHHYVSAAFESGWRLAGLTNKIWGAFKRARERGHIKGKINIPMQPFTAVVDGVLKDLNRRVPDDPNPSVGARLLDDLIELADYIGLENSNIPAKAGR